MSLARSFFLTGTDTNVGKTYLGALLIKAWRAQGLDGIGFKPLCCGERTDAELLHAASDSRLSLNQVNPVWLRPPAAPYTASLIENRPIDLDLIRETYAQLSAAHHPILVEGVGGWRVPITQDFAMNDFAAELGLPVLVVAANRLGALNHTLLTVEAIQRQGLECAGVILNQAVAPLEDVATPTNRSILESLLDVPLLAEIQFGQSAWPLA